jgi:Calpain large subunit, domain III
LCNLHEYVANLFCCIACITDETYAAALTQCLCSCRIAYSHCNSNYLANPGYAIAVTQPTHLIVRLIQASNADTTVNNGNRPALNVALYKTKPDGTLHHKSKPTLERAVATSNAGVYTDCVCGCVFEQQAVEPGEYHIIVSTFLPNIEASFNLLVYSNPPLSQVFQIR